GNSRAWRERGKSNATTTVIPEAVIGDATHPASAGRLAAPWILRQRPRRMTPLDCTAPMVLSLVMRDVLALVFDEFNKGFLHDIGKRAIVFCGKLFQMLAQPDFA